MKWLERFWFGCAHCRGGEGCPVTRADSAGGGPASAGVELVAAALTVFLLPLMLAIAGAWLAGGRAMDGSFAAVAGWQLGGAAVGMVAGVALAGVLVHWRWGKRRGASGDAE